MKSASSIVEVIKKLQVTEKGTAMTEKQNKYLFRVDPKANKVQIKRAVELFYGVKVSKVNTMNYLGKAKRTRTQKYGRTSDWKRAVVTLKDGSKIDLA